MSLSRLSPVLLFLLPCAAGCRNYADCIADDPVARRLVLVMRNVTGWPSGEGVELVERLAGDGGRYAGR